MNLCCKLIVRLKANEYDIFLRTMATLLAFFVTGYGIARQIEMRSHIASCTRRLSFTQIVVTSSLGTSEGQLQILSPLLANDHNNADCNLSHFNSMSPLA